ELVAHLVAHDATHADAPWLRQSFEACRDVDAIAVDVLVVDDDVAHVQPDAELDAPLRRHLGVALGHFPLDIDGTPAGVDDAGKLAEDAIARRLDDASAVFRDLRIDDCASQALERSQRAFLVQAHQPRIAHDISGEDGRETTLDPFSAHG